MNDDSHPARFNELGRREKRALLLDAAIDVFAEVGFANATIKRIAALAGTADGTLYNHFPNKEALLLGVADRLREQHDRALAQVDLSSGGVEELFAVMAAESEGSLRELKVVLQQVLVDDAFRRKVASEIVAPMRKRAEAALVELLGAEDPASIDTELILRLIAAPAAGHFCLRPLDDADVKARWPVYL